MYIFIVSILALPLCLGVIFAIKHRNANRQNAEWEKRHPRAGFKYCGKTLLFYEPSHGNQIELLDGDGRCYLWYPGNDIIVKGRWRIDESNIYFQYGGDTFNPVTGVTGGRWEACPVAAWMVSIVEDVAGDILNIKKHFPYILERNPPIRSLSGLESPEVGRSA